MGERKKMIREFTTTNYSKVVISLVISFHWNVLHKCLIRENLPPSACIKTSAGCFRSAINACIHSCSDDMWCSGRVSWESAIGWSTANDIRCSAIRSSTSSTAATKRSTGNTLICASLADTCQCWIATAGRPCVGAALSASAIPGRRWNRRRMSRRRRDRLSAEKVTSSVQPFVFDGNMDYLQVSVDKRITDVNYIGLTFRFNTWKGPIPSISCHGLIWQANSSINQFLNWTWLL